MKIAPNPASNRACCAFAAAVLASAVVPAWAAQPSLPVSVINTPSVTVTNTAPIPVVGNVTATVRDPALTAFQKVGYVQIAIGSGGTAYVPWFSVPAGVRLVIENLNVVCTYSASAVKPYYVIVTYGTGVNHFMPIVEAGGDNGSYFGIANASARLYANAGSAVQLSVSGPVVTTNPADGNLTGCQVTLNGYTVAM